MGIGIRQSISRFHAARDDMEAIHLALRPGITGASARFGGDERNAGAGLFFTKSIARVSRNFFVVYSGEAMFKLLKGPGEEQPSLLPDPAADRATREVDLPPWPGTVIGIDINVATHTVFSELLGEIRQAYHLDVKDQKRRIRRAKFR